MGAERKAGEAKRLAMKSGPASQHLTAIHTAIEVPVVTLPEAERALLEATYARAEVILEYGSGGSTLIAAAGQHRQVTTVESDEAWAQNLTAVLARDFPDAPVRVHWVDVGPTRAWGRPATDQGWRRYHRYPLSVWDRPDFLPPEVILIDGRFRVACFMAALLRTTRPTTVLWDDYVQRPPYARVERFAKPVEFVGRMARFELRPVDLPRSELTEVIGWFNDPN